MDNQTIRDISQDIDELTYQLQTNEGLRNSKELRDKLREKELQLMFFQGGDDNPPEWGEI